MGQASLSPARPLQALEGGGGLLRRLNGLLAGLLFQGPCAGCGSWVGEAWLGGLCRACWGEAPWLERPRLRPRRPLDGVGAGLAYQGRLRQALRAYKFEGRASLKRPLGRLLAAAARRACPSLAFDAAVPVPPSRRSLKERGRDAGGELARLAARELGLPLWPALRRRGERGRQSELDRPGRLANARLAFEALPAAGLHGARLLLLDDIHTTGATLADAARALKAAGAARVEAVALARS